MQRPASWLFTRLTALTALVVLALPATGLVGSAGAAAPASTWPMERGDAGSTGSMVGDTGISAATVKRLSPIWRRGGDVEPLAPVGYANGTVISRCRPGLCAFRPSDGALLWSAGDTQSPFVVSGDTVVAATADGIRGIALADGAWRWDVPLPASPEPEYSNAVTAMSVAGGVAYVLDAFSTIIAVDAASGSTAWTAPSSLESDQHYAPLVDGDRVYVPGTGDVFDRTTGERVGAMGLNKPMGNRAWTIAAGKVFMIDADGNAVAVNTGVCPEAGCSPVWKTALPASNHSYVAGGFAFADGVLYVSAFETGTDALHGRLFALDADTGSVLWQSNRMAMVGPLVVANGVVYGGTWNGRVNAWPAAGCGSSTCSVLWGSQVDAPAVHEDHDVVVADGHVFAFTGGRAYALAPLPSGSEPPAKPSAPTNVAVTRAHNSVRADLDFTIPASDGGWPITAYQLRVTDGSVAAYIDPGNDGGGHWHGTILGLDPNKTYSFVVAARTAAGQGADSQPVNASN